MLIEDCAYSNRWRKIEPIAKAIFTASGLFSAMTGRDPIALLIITGSNAIATILGAKVSLRAYLRIFMPSLSFLLLSGSIVAVSLHRVESFPYLSFRIENHLFPQILLIWSRSLACLSATLFLALTTPITDIITLLRRIRMPAIILDIMVLCYRITFVFWESVKEIHIAQSARLGHITFKTSFYSFGKLVTSITTQVWWRSRALQLSALARNTNDSFRFLVIDYSDRFKSIVIASLSGGIIFLISRINI